MAGQKTEQPIGAVIRRVLKDTKRQHGALFALQRDWAKLVGNALAGHTKPVSLRRGRLIVHVDRPGESFALSYQRAELLERLRRRAKGCVEEIVLRAGEL